VGNVAYPDASLDAFVATAHDHGVKVCLAIGGDRVIETGGVFARSCRTALARRW
jgi:hypothetical protein